MIGSGDHTPNSYPLMEDFYTLQGEGFHTGTAAYFIRLAGCDVGCVWCDVKDSWDADKYPIVAADEILNRALKFESKTAVITGGEPAIYDLNYLTELLKENKFKVHIETSGTRHLSGVLDWITVSPKKFKEPLNETLVAADELKVIINHPSDLAWALSFKNRVNENCKLFLQPEFEKREKMIPMITEFILMHPEWRISLQTHKIIGIP